MGCWDAWCPVCGLCFHSPFIESYSIDFSTEFIKIIKQTKWMEKVTVLIPDKKAQHGFIEVGCNITFLNERNDIEYDLEKLSDGLALHTECWKLAKSKKIELKYEDFDYKRAKLLKMNKYSIWNQYIFKYIDYSPVKKYFDQDFKTDKLYKTSKDWYILFNPNNKKIDQSKKNNDRIVKNLNKIIKFKPKMRPSPSVTATIFEKGTEKIGNDGNIYVVEMNKNGSLRWEKKKNSNSKSCPKESASKYNLGTEKKGIDGNIYVVKKTSNGIKEWILKNKNKSKNKK